MAPRYAIPEYQAAHDDIFARPLIEGIETVLPPGVSQEDFGRALKELVGAIGKDAVFSGADLKEYVDPYEIPEAEHERKVPSAAACPSSVEEIQAILKIANTYTIPVWTFSRGKNLGYGGPAPVVSGSLALDLHRMNKVLEVNEKFAYAVVEPGVTFGELYLHCAKNKLKVWPSTPSLGWGSVVGNTLDRGMGFMPASVHHEFTAGMEVVLANGDVVRTGQFAMTTSQSAHLTRLTYGPTIDGLFLQSNLGIVTKMGIHLTPQPQAYMACTFDMPDMEDIAPLVDVFGEMRRSGLLRSMVFVNSIGEYACMFGKRVDFWDKEGTIPDWRLKEIQKELDIGWWIVKWGFYGTKDVIQAQFDQVKKVVGRDLPTGRLVSACFDGKDEQLLEATDVPDPYGGMFVGVPSLWSLPLVRYNNAKNSDGDGAHGAYSPIIPLDGKTLLDWVKTAKQIYEKHGIDLMCDFFLHERHALFVCMLCFDKTNPKQRVAIDKIFYELFKEGTKKGFGKYRAHVAHMDMVADLFDFNDHAYRRFVETIKDSLDPNGILSPGKMGIWPRRFREQRQNGLNGGTATSET